MSWLRTRVRYTLHPLYQNAHSPSVPNALDSAIDIESSGDGWNSIGKRLRDDEIDRQTVWN